MNRPAHSANSLHAVISLLAVFLSLALLAGSAQASVDIGPMTWTQRSDWVNVKNCAATYPGTTNAVGDGNADDTAAIQSVMTYVQNNMNWDWVAERSPLTIYFPPGTYKISSTLAMGTTSNANMFGVSLIGCGSRTVIKWASTAPIGPAMFAPDGTDVMRYLGFVWDGSNRAGCGIELNTTGKFTSAPGSKASTIYETQIRIENSSFKNFNQLGNYAPTNPNLPLYGAGIAQGFFNSNPKDSNGDYVYPYPAGSPLDPTGETMVYNCRFFNCTLGVATAETGENNNYMWNVDGCEFDQCIQAGVYCADAGGYLITNCHFQQTTDADIVGGDETRVRHCTSQGSGMFYTESGSARRNGIVLEDDWVDGWLGDYFQQYRTGNAVTFQNFGPDTLFDCRFTHPPANSPGVIYNGFWDSIHPTVFPVGSWSSLILSNNTLDTGLNLMVANSTPTFNDTIPPGRLGGLVSSPTQTFLKTSWPPDADSAHIIDVTKAPYTADSTGKTDSTATIQAAINAAQAANNGSVVYFPVGSYMITSTLTATGGNYTLQGSGIRSVLFWAGAPSSVLLAISNPQNITVQELQTSGLNLSSSNTPAATCILETATGPSRAIYDEVQCPLNYNNGNYNLPPGPGFVLSNLPAGSTVYLKHVVVPLTVTNCGAAQILSKYLQFSTVNVSGTAPATGFLGVMEGEGGQYLSHSAYNITIGDNQDFVMDDYYTEQAYNDLDLERGQGTGTGRVSIQGIFDSAAQGMSVGANTTAILVNNYAGRLFYAAQAVSNGANPNQITVSGTNPLDMDFVGDIFYGTPGTNTLMLSPLTNLYGAENIGANSLVPGVSPSQFSTDTPSPLSAAALTSMTAGMDHLRQLETMEASQQAGLVANWKLDEADGTTSADSSLSGLNGTKVNSPAFSASTPPAIGLFDPGSLSFNGVNQSVSIPVTAALPSGYAPRTLCGWAKSNSLTGGWRWIASYGSPNTSQAMFIGMNGTTLYGGGYGDDLSVPNFWDNNWHFIALTYDGGVARLYADGVLRATGAKNWNLAPGYCFIGQQVNTYAEYWNGLIDDVRVYNRVLSDADIASLAGAPAPYAGTPFGNNGAAWPIPGQIEAENYDSGGQNIAYYDDSSGNYGNASYRGDDVDIRTSNDVGGGYQVGWTDTGEWLKYSVSVAATGHYTFQVRTASGVAGSGHLEVDGANVSGPIVLPNTGSWDTFTTVNVPGVRLTAGPHVLRFYWDGGYPDVNWFNFVQTGP